MGINRSLLSAESVTADTAMTGIAAGTVTGGPEIVTARVKQGTLSALVKLTAATATIALRARWEVATTTGGTFYPVMMPDNAPEKVAVIGTAAAISFVLQAPDSVYGWPIARIAIVNEVVTGQAGDKYQIGYYGVKETAV